MRRFRETMLRFFAGRYGLDTLGRVLMYTYMGTVLLNVFLRSRVVFCIELLLLIWCLFRMFSRNTSARVRENQRFLGIFSSVRTWFRLQRARVRDRKTHVFRKCPACKAVVRLPKSKRGQHTCTCPRCRRDFSVKI